MIEMSSFLAPERPPGSPMPALHANGQTLSSAPNRLGYLNPTSAGASMAQMRRQFDEQGYLFLKGFLDRQAVIDFRGWVFEHLAKGGLLEPGSEFSAGISASTPGRQGLARSPADVAGAIHRL
jgi:hypothetical protein